MSGESGSRNLTAKQQRFVAEYVVDWNATQAAIRAGYREKTAYRQGADLLKKPQIVAEIDRRREILAKDTKISAERTLTEVGRLAFADIRKLFTPDGQLRSIEALDDEIAAAVQSVKVVTRSGPMEEDEEEQAHGGTLKRRRSKSVEYVHEIKLADKNTALEKLMKYLGQYEADNRQRSPLEGLPPEVLIQIVEKLHGHRN